MKSLFLSSLLALAPVLYVQHATSAASEQQSEARHITAKAYLPIEEIRKRYKVNNYSAFENPTGIYFRAGDEARITLSDEAKGQVIRLIVHDFGESGHHAVYPLQAGENVLRIQQAGLAYINYLHPQGTGPDVKVNIKGGVVNGVFTREHSAAEWKQMLANAKSPMIDMLGERVQLVYHVDQLRKQCPEKGPELLATYDHIIKIQQDMMGWGSLIPQPKNHILGRNIWRGFMHADGMGAAFHHNTMQEVGNAERLPKSSWGVAHEFGHVNQVRPGMLWVGTGEITNNIFSAWTNYLLNPSSMRLEHEVTPSPNGNIRGGRLHCYIHSARVLGQPWQYQNGPDNYRYPAKPISLAERIRSSKQSYDHFVNVAPLWQLQLYAAVAQGKADFYPQIFQKVRETDESQLTQGQMRINFMKNACDALGMNLSRFFIETGMLQPLNRWKNDYGSRMLTVTPKMVDEVLTHAAQYPEPDSSVIYYITSNSAPIFKNKTALTQGKPQRVQQGKITIPADQWQGAVAFEVYSGKKLVGVSLLGLGHQDNKSTDVFFPAGSTELKAVSYDGKRVTVPLEG